MEDGREADFLPLPLFVWDERPETLPLDAEECATALFLANGDSAEAAALLKVPIIRLNRMIKHSPRLQRVQEESLHVALAKAASVPIKTLFNPASDQRALEWASTKVLQSRLAAGHPLSPAPANSGVAASLTVDQSGRRLQFRWRQDSDDLTLPGPSPEVGDASGD